MTRQNNTRVIWVLEILMTDQMVQDEVQRCEDFINSAPDARDPLEELFKEAIIQKVRSRIEHVKTRVGKWNWCMGHENEDIVRFNYEMAQLADPSNEYRMVKALIEETDGQFEMNDHYTVIPEEFANPIVDFTH